MPIEFNCHVCGKLLRTSDDKAGKTASCPGCGEKITVPGPGGRSYDDYAADDSRHASADETSEYEDYDDYDDYGSDEYEPGPRRPARGRRRPRRSGGQNSLATVSLLTGISGLLIMFPGFCCGCLMLLSIPLDVTAVITGAIALNQIAKQGEEGKPLAMTGVICGALGLVLFVVLLFLGVAARLQQPNQFKF